MGFDADFLYIFSVYAFTVKSEDQEAIKRNRDLTHIKIQVKLLPGLKFQYAFSENVFPAFVAICCSLQWLHSRFSFRSEESRVGKECACT